MIKRLIGKPAIRIALALVVLLVPWPGLGRVFASYFSAYAETTVNLVSRSTLEVALVPAAPKGPDWSVVFAARDSASGESVSATLDVRRSAWVPLAVLIALAVAFPVKDRKRRLLVVGAGALAIHALALLSLLAFFGGTQGRIFALSEPVYILATVGYRALLAPPAMAYALPALLWFVLSWKLEPELM